MTVKQNCQICNGDVEHFFNQTLLEKYEVSYFYCNNCGFLQTEEPYWLEEAYGSAIADADTGLVDRNVSISRMLSNSLYFLFKKDGKYLDIAGGYGMLTRLMRDIGFDFYWSDPYCGNILSKGFDLSTTTPPFDAITAFEVLEHVYDPLAFIQESFDKAKTSTIIFSTLLFSENPPNPSEWYYYSPKTGQHISFFQIKTLRFIAKKLSLNLYSCRGFHMLTDKKMSIPLTWVILTGHLYNVIGSCVKFAMRSNSKTLSDHYKMLETHD